MQVRKLLLSVVCWFLLLTGPANAETDPQSGLLVDPGWELVRNNCIACHSLKLVTQNRGDREHWLALIRWMQETQNLWQFDSATEAGILDYLAKNYGVSLNQRRPALAPELMPGD